MANGKYKINGKKISKEVSDNTNFVRLYKR